MMIRANVRQNTSKATHTRLHKLFTHILAWHADCMLARQTDIRMLLAGLHPLTETA